MPLGHINAAYVRSHFDAIEVGINDAPKAGEIIYILAMFSVRPQLNSIYNTLNKVAINYAQEGPSESMHDIRVVQRPGNLADLSASPVELRIDDAPGVAVEVTRATSLNPSVGMIQRLENQVRALPEEVTKREARLASARQEVVDAREALDVPIKHQDAAFKEYYATQYGNRGRA